jgi:integrase
MWTADYSFINVDGKSQHSRKSLGTRNRQIAEQRARELEVKLTKGEFKPEPAGPTSTQRAIDAFIGAKETEGASGKTLTKYCAELENYDKFLKQHRANTLQNINVRLDDLYRSHRMQIDGLETYTIYSHTMIRKSWLAWCVTRNLLAASPLAGVKFPRPRRRKYPAATLQQLNQILTGASGYLIAVLAVLAFTGLRIGEVAALRPQDVDLVAGLIHVRRRSEWGPKTEASERSVPLHPRLLALLRAMPKGKGSTFFNAPPSSRFPNGDHPINPCDINEQFQALAKRHGFVVGRKNVGLTVHALRPTFKTCCFDAGVPKPMLDRWIGHEDQNDMDVFYYDPQKSQEWMQRVPFGEPNGLDIKVLAGDCDEKTD